MKSERKIMPENAVEEWPEGKDFRPSRMVDAFLELGDGQRVDFSK
jgi:hypothetical protein